MSPETRATALDLVDTRTGQLELLEALASSMVERYSEDDRLATRAWVFALEEARAAREALRDLYTIMRDQDTG